jgi:hypothetical protein
MENAKLISVFDMLIDKLDRVEQKVSAIETYMKNEIRFRSIGKYVNGTILNDKFTYDICNFKFFNQNMAFVNVQLVPDTNVTSNTNDIFYKMITSDDRIYMCSTTKHHKYIDEMCLLIHDHLISCGVTQDKIKSITVVGVSRFLNELIVMFLENATKVDIKNYIYNLHAVEKRIISDAILYFYETDNCILPLTKKVEDVEYLLTFLDPYNFIYLNDAH